VDREKQRQLKSALSGPNREPSSQNVKLIGSSPSVRTVVELPWAADSCPCVVEAANRVTSNCWYQRPCGAVGAHLRWLSSAQHEQCRVSGVRTCAVSSAVDSCAVAASRAARTRSVGCPHLRREQCGGLVCGGGVLCRTARCGRLLHGLRARVRQLAVQLQHRLTHREPRHLHACPTRCVLSGTEPRFREQLPLQVWVEEVLCI
jgi:hypothetical protein